MRELLENEKICPKCKKESKYRGNDGGKLAYWKCFSCGHDYTTIGKQSTFKTPEIKRGYVNINSDQSVSGIFSSVLEANNCADAKRIACILISYRENQGIK